MGVNGVSKEKLPLASLSFGNKGFAKWIEEVSSLNYLEAYIMRGYLGFHPGFGFGRASRIVSGEILISGPQSRCAR